MVSTGTFCPAAGSVPTTCPAGSVPSTGTGSVFGKSDALRICLQMSTVWPTQPGITLLPGPVPTMIVITFVIADVELACGLVDMTRPFNSGVEADGACVTFSKPALLSLRSASAGDRPFTSGTSACSGPVDTLIAMSSPAATAALAGGSVLITRPGGT